MNWWVKKSIVLDGKRRARARPPEVLSPEHPMTNSSSSNSDRTAEETKISVKAIETYRAKSYTPERRLATVDQAIKFVQERGFVFFWPTKGIEFPSLWTAVAGNRPVANEHDDPGHVTWGWKDQMLGKREWYYAKKLRKKATLISLEVAPYFYALTENYGDPEQDYLIQYEAGRLKQENKLVYEALLRNGPMDTVALRRKVGLTSKESKYRFERALLELQAEYEDPAYRSGRGGRLELRLHLRHRAPPLSGSAGSSQTDQGAGGAIGADQTVLSFGWRGLRQGARQSFRVAQSAVKGGHRAGRERRLGAQWDYR